VIALRPSKKLVSTSRDRKVATSFCEEMILSARWLCPDHKELDRGTLRAIIRAAGLGGEEFNKILY
jgi:hypothetical protein